MRKHIFVLLGLIFALGSSPLHAQTWKEMWENADRYTFAEIQAAYDDYYRTHEKMRGDGSKQFERWAYAMSERLDPSGRVVDARLRAWKAREAYRSDLQAANSRTAINDGGNWRFLGASNGLTKNGNGYEGIGHLEMVTFDPNDPDVLYALSPPGGIWKSTNHGSTWACITDNAPFHGGRHLVIDPTNTAIMYLLSGDAYTGGSIWKTVNGGQSWSMIGPVINHRGDDYYGRKIMLHPLDHQVVVALLTNTDSSGIYLSTNSGTSWNCLKHGTFYDFEFHPTQPYTAYLSGKSKVFRTTNGGADWTPIHDFLSGEATRLAVSPDEPDYVYALGGNVPAAGTFSGLWRSTDAGDNWESRSTSPNLLGYDGTDDSNLAGYALALAVSPVDADRVHVGAGHEWTSVDGGVTWAIQRHMDPSAPIVDLTHADCHDLRYNDGKLYYCHDGGLYYSTDEGYHWIDISEGLGIAQIHRIAGSPQQPGILILGCQDVGTHLLVAPFPDGDMKAIGGGDGMDCAIDPQDHLRYYYSLQNGALRYSADGGQTDHLMAADPGAVLGKGGFLTPFVLNPQRPRTVLAGFRDVGVLYEAGVGAWINLSNGKIDTSKACKAVAYAPSDTMTIYVLKPDSVYRTYNYGSTWTNITAGLPQEVKSSIAVDPTNKHHIFLTLQSWLPDQRIYESTNGGNTWTNLSGTGELPNVPAHRVVYQSGTADGLYLGLETGVYYRDDNLGVWVDFSGGLPFISVEDLEINYTDRTLRAGTWGRGAWASDLYGELCPSSQNLNGLIAGNALIESGGSFASTQTIADEADIIYHGSAGIQLNAGFKVVPGAEFLAEYATCLPGANAPVPPTYDWDTLITPASPGSSATEFHATLAPNPSDGYARLTIGMPKAGYTKVELYDLQRRHIATLAHGWIEAGYYSWEVPTAELAAGTYLLRVQSGLDLDVLKLVVQH